MQYTWDRNEGRWTTILADGVVAHASRDLETEWWVLYVPALGIRETIRNRRLLTWSSAGPVVERVLRAQLYGPELASSTGDRMRRP